MPSVVISTSSSGNITLVAAQGTTKSIRVRGYLIASNGATDVTWKDTAGTAYTGALYCTGVANGGVVAPICPPNGEPWFQLPQNTGLVLNNSAAIAIGGNVVYDVVG